MAERPGDVSCEVIRLAVQAGRMIARYQGCLTLQGSVVAKFTGSRVSRKWMGERLDPDWVYEQSRLLYCHAHGWLAVRCHARPVQEAGMAILQGVHFLSEVIHEDPAPGRESIAGFKLRQGLDHPV